MVLLFAACIAPRLLREAGGADEALALIYVREIAGASRWLVLHGRMDVG